MRPRAPAVAAVIALGLVLGASWQMAAGGSGEDDVLGPGDVTVKLDVHHSRFGPERLVVRRGTTVRFIVDNRDPINHELIVGPEDVHRRHEDGTEPAHEARPGEVTVPALTRATTTYRFDDTGTVRFACHLPGHLAYGMEGTVVVR